MDPQDLRIRIAQSEGWKKDEENSRPWNNIWFLNGERQPYGVVPPLYHHRRDDIMDVIHKIPEGERDEFIVHLSRALNYVMMDSRRAMSPPCEWVWDILKATPQQLCEGYVRYLDWKASAKQSYGYVDPLIAREYVEQGDAGVDECELARQGIRVKITSWRENGTLFEDMRSTGQLFLHFNVTLFFRPDTSVYDFMRSWQTQFLGRVINERLIVEMHRRMVAMLRLARQANTVLTGPEMEVAKLDPTKWLCIQAAENFAGIPRMFR